LALVPQRSIRHERDISERKLKSSLRNIHLFAGNEFRTWSSYNTTTIEAATTSSQQCRDFLCSQFAASKVSALCRAAARASIQHFASTPWQARLSQNFRRLAHRAFSNVSFSFIAEWEILKADFCKIVQRSRVFCRAALYRWKLCKCDVLAQIIPSWFVCRFALSSCYRLKKIMILGFKIG